MVAISSNTIGWDYRQILSNDTFLFVLDSHTCNRSYLIIENIKIPSDILVERSKLNFLYIAASQWQCIRAERNASNDIRLRDMRAAKYLDEIKERDLFLDKMKLVQNISLNLSKHETLDELFKAAVEAVRDDMGFDRSVFMLLDYKQGS
ncbi:GGDEF domain-containing protein, partial [Aliivibrio sifiae]